MNSNLVSIVTAVHNGATFLEKTIQSVLDQSYTTWELILIDDASTDNSKDIIEKYKRIDERISSFYNKINLGPGETRNIGIKEAKGKYLAFLDSDDRWHENKLGRTN